MTPAEIAAKLTPAQVRALREKLAHLQAYDGDGDPSGAWDHKIFVKIEDILSILSAIIPAEVVMRPETEMENIARDMREGRFPARSEPQMVPNDWSCVGCGSPPPFNCQCVTDLAHVKGTNNVEFKYAVLAALSSTPAAASPAPDPVVNALEIVACAMWRHEAERAAPNVARGRTLKAFRDELPATQDRFLGLAAAALAALPKGGA